ncbi:MAG: hypothetical protein II883_04895 [Spirochaetales bacterium]|nr:hypothetical protein [Spirochaetales bacterium]MBQ3728733.1 hypothetical protein [Spirochaetales bacterium]MBQ4501336.1 hypothetical protein [Spirochaetales bacterium]MBQ5391551.1 hypothetical protein [Spirochaetales bacterium]MBQ6124497.1 hypothetical protein [Spirochaetales bacterium]
MPNLNLEIDNQKRDIERSRAELSQMYLELGEVAAAWHDAISYAPSQDAYGRLVNLCAEKNDVDTRIDALKTAVSEMSAGDRRIEQTKISMKELDKRFSVLISSLGAVAIEIDSAGKLPQRLKKCLEPMRDYETRLNDLEQKCQKYRSKGPALLASVLEKKIQKTREEIDSVFAETGKRIYNSGDFREVPGQRAKAILDEMEQIRSARKNYKNDILDHKNMIDEAQGSLVSMGVYGEESRKLRELQGKQNELADRLSDVYTEYGQRLAEGIPYWMDNQAPEELKKCCNQIIRQTSRIAQQNLNLEHLMMEKDIEIHNLKLSQLSEQMNHLNSQIQAIENQKAELQQRVDAELKAISDLKMKQSEITYKVTQYE